MLDHTLSNNTLIKMIKSFKQSNEDKENRVLYKTEKQQLLITEEDKSNKSTENKKDNQIKRKKSTLE
jgi:Sec-independent protein translocase protein TatA